MHARPTKPKESWDLRRRRAERKAQSRTCPCGSPFQYVPKLRELYCSKNCALHSRLGARCEWRCGLQHWSCDECGTDQLTKRSRRFCSDRCEARWFGRSNYRPTPPRHYECVVCRQPFTRQGRHGSPLTCSPPCGSRLPSAMLGQSTRNTRRLERLRAGWVEPVDPETVFQRDGGFCQICGGEVPRRLKHPHPLSATMDHRIPLAADGTHGYANVQLAHFICNSRKRDLAA